MAFLRVLKSKSTSSREKNSGQELSYSFSCQLLYEFFYLFTCSKEIAMDYSYSVWQAIDKKWKDKQSLNTKEEEKFFLRDLFCLALEVLQKEDLSAHFSPASPFFSKLSPFEFMLLILRDRFLLEKEEIESILNCTPGSLELQLMQVREKFFHSLFPEEKTSFPLLERVRCNQVLDSSMKLERKGSSVKAFSSPYYIALEKARSHCQRLTVPSLKKEEFRNLFLQSPEKENLIWQKIKSKRAQLWQHRFVWQGLGLSILGTATIIFLSFEMKSEKRKESIVPSSLSNGKVDTVRSSFSGIEGKGYNVPEKFPLGPSYKKGAAHKAPSLQRKTIYRLIVQSENPKEISPHVKSIFRETNVKESDRSGSAMPGGIYFDGVVQAKNYPKIYKALSRIAPTNAYLNKNKKRIRKQEKARVIIWVQQI